MPQPLYSWGKSPIPIAGWVGPRASLDAATKKKFLGIKPWPSIL